MKPTDKYMAEKNTGQRLVDGYELLGCKEDIREDPEKLNLDFLVQKEED